MFHKINTISIFYDVNNDVFKLFENLKSAYFLSTKQ